MNAVADWVFHPETGTFKNSRLTDEIRRLALEDTSPLRPDVEGELPENEDAGWTFRYEGRLADIRFPEQVAAFYPCVRHFERAGRPGELRAMIPTNFGERKVLAWYIPRVA